ncbi:hypothetical protein ElyMa_004548300 [Elysia marginata]|uniref:Uncharacterized protein n=1 Tax=Elysia marginata TaxID=1093978 RepID=A0AAV4HQL7_9GAST|nr:hypothetical protein ElyMa_004548300 [Elysia marginata]
MRMCFDKKCRQQYTKFSTKTTKALRNKYPFESIMEDYFFLLYPLSQAKGEMEIERQTQYNGKDTLPLPGQRATGDHSRGGPTPDAAANMSHLLVPASSPVIGHRGNSRSVSRSSARSGSSSGSRSGSRTRSKSRSRHQSTEKRTNQSSDQNLKLRKTKTNVAQTANSVKNIIGIKSISLKPRGFKDFRN